MKTIIIGVFLREQSALSEYFLKMADEFIKLGYRVIIITDENRKDLVDTKSNPMILTWPSYYPTKWTDFIFIKNLINKYQPKMLIANFTATNLFLITGAIFGVPNRVAWIRSIEGAFAGEIPTWRTFRRRFVYKLATKIIVNSYATKEDAISKFHIKIDRINILPNLVRSNDNYIHANKETNKIIFVGRLHKSKGVDVLLKALSIVKKEFPGIKLELIAGGEQADYIKLVEKLDLEKNVLFLGRQPREKVLEHFAKAQFSIVPSLLEAFGYVVIEAFSTKTPVVGSNTGGIAEIIENRKSGLLFSVGDHEDLASKIILLLKDSELRSRCEKGAYLRFKEKYDLEQNIGKVAKMFSKAIEHNIH